MFWALSRRRVELARKDLLPIFKPSNLKAKLERIPVNLSKPTVRKVLVTESQQEGLISVGGEMLY
jgi:hypothetical protein